MKFTYSISPLCMLALLACSPATEEPVPSADNFSTQAQSILQSAYPDDGPGAAVIVTKDNENVFTSAQGLADLSDGTVITPDTVFRYASITKQFAAATLMLLSEEGLVDLDAPIGDYLTDYPEPGRNIAVRHLLNHTSGIPSYTSIPGWMVEENTSREYATDEMIAEFKDLPVDFEPGEQFAYNNSGYLLLGAVIEAVTGQPWADAVQDRIMGPLNIDGIASGLTEANNEQMAVGYTAENALAQSVHMSVPHAAGALIGDVQGLADWANAFHDGDVVNAESYTAMTQPTAISGGDDIPYGYGLVLDDMRGQPTIGHSGGIFGFSTDSVYIPAEDIFVAVLANSDNPETSPSIVTRRLAALAKGDPYPSFEAQPLNLNDLEPALGVYESEEVKRTLFVRDDLLYTVRDGGREAEVYGAGDSRYFYGANDLDWFELDGAGDARRMLFHDDNDAEPDVLVWTGPVPDSASVSVDVLETYLGTYTLSIPMVAVIAASEGGLEAGISIQLTGQPPFDLQANSDTEFAVPSVGAVVQFAPDDAGVMTLTILQGGQTITGERSGD